MMEPSPYSPTTPNIEPTRPLNGNRTPMSFARFISIAVISIFLFPVASICSVLAFWLNDHLSSLVLCIYVVLQATFLSAGLTRRGHARRLCLPIILATAAILGYNRHRLGRVDNSPFSDGIGTVDQRTYGVFAWFRKFDQPFDQFGQYYVDWMALAANFELVIVLTVLLAIASHYWGFAKKPTAKS